MQNKISSKNERKPIGSARVQKSLEEDIVLVKWLVNGCDTFIEMQSVPTLMPYIENNPGSIYLTPETSMKLARALNRLRKSPYPVDAMEILLAGEPSQTPLLMEAREKDYMI